MTNTWIAPDDDRIAAAVRGYCEALLSVNAIDSDGMPVSGAAQDYAPVGLTDFTPDAQATIVAEVWDFIQANAADFEAYTEFHTAEQFGADFLLTASGHGAGFWARGLGSLGDRLTANARPCGSLSAIVDPDTEPGDIDIECG